MLIPFLGTTAPFLDKFTGSSSCTASIVAMDAYPNPMAQGEGIRCKTQHQLLKGTTDALKQQLAHEMVTCYDQFDRFERNPFHTSQLENICLVCTTLSFDTQVQEINDFDLYLLQNQYKNTPYFELFTGRPSTGFEQAEFAKTPDKISLKEEYTVIWVYSNDPNLDSFLNATGMQKQQDVLVRDMLFFIPDVTVTSTSLPSTALGFGAGMFTSSPAESNNEAIILMPKKTADAMGCVTLDGSLYLPIA